MELPPTSPVRLGVAVDSSVLYHDILDSADCACHLAKQAVEDARAKVELFLEQNYGHIIPLIQVLQPNLMQWTDM